MGSYNYQMFKYNPETLKIIIRSKKIMLDDEEFPFYTGTNINKLSSPWEVQLLEINI